MITAQEAKDKFWFGVIVGAVTTCAIFAIGAGVILATFP